MQLPSIDYYNNAKTPNPNGKTNLREFITSIRGTEFACRVADIRQAIKDNDLTRASGLKRLLPAVSLSGSLGSGGRKDAVKEGRFQHSGMLQIDIDKCENLNFTVDEVSSILAKDPHICAIFTSPSGTGVKAVARISSDPSDHLDCFFAAEKHFWALGLKIDASCKDPARLCFVSHDKKARLIAGDSFFLPQAPMRAVTKNLGISELKEIQFSDVAEMLKVIPSEPKYDDWLKIASAVWSCLGETAGNQALDAWSPEQGSGGYGRKFSDRLTRIGAGTLIMIAKKHGYSRDIKSSNFCEIDQAIEAKLPDSIPAHIFPVPAGGISYTLAAQHIFSYIAPTHTIFMRARVMHEVSRNSSGDMILLPVSANRFSTVVEKYQAKIMRLENRPDGTTQWRATVFPVKSAQALQESCEAFSLLPPINQLVSCPILILTDETETKLLECGWHSYSGGTYVSNNVQYPHVDLGKAIELLYSVLEEFNFVSASDQSRALASLISPALKIGGWLKCDFPLDVAEADQSQSGKTFRQKIVCEIYKEVPEVLTNTNGGVGSIDEKISTALIRGRPFISLENFRGKLDSQILESAIRGLGHITCRALRTSVEVDTTRFLWQLSTNGAELTKDIANRSVITRIRKQPREFEFKEFDEGDLLSFVKAKQPIFLASVHSVIKEWARQGFLRTKEKRHDFREWAQSLDWIVQNILGAAPLMDGHLEEQGRVGNAKAQWLRDLVIAIVSDDIVLATPAFRTGFTATNLIDMAKDYDLPIPGCNSYSEKSEESAVGKIMAKLFREEKNDFIKIDSWKIFRFCPNGTNIYVIESQ